MTKAELEKEAEVYVKNLLEGTEFEDDEMDVCAYTKREMLEAILHFSEPREKQIQALGERCLQLQKDKGNLTDRVKELEAQIEKMECCGNCKYLTGKFDTKTHINILFCKETDMREIQVGFNMCCCKWKIKEK